MATKIAQSTVANPGASNAEDFQPPTRNPQVAPGQIFPQNTTLQQPSSESLLRDGNLRIKVPTHKAPARTGVTEVKSGQETLIFALVIAVVVVALLHWLNNRRRGRVVTETLPDLPSKVPVALPIEPLTDKKATKKPVPKKSKSKRKKRSRR